MASQDVNLVFRLKDEVTGALKKVEGGLSSVDKTANTAGKGIVKTFEGAVKPVSQFFRAIGRVGFIFGATFGTAGALVNNVSDKLDEMDSSAARLGITTEELSRKLYGFNVATDSVRSGVNLTKGLMNDMQAGILIMGAGISTFLSNASAQVASWQTGAKKEEILKEMSAKKVATQETINLEVSVTEQIKKLTMSETGFKKHQLDLQIADLRRAGVEEVKIRQLINASNMQDAITHAKRMNTLVAENSRLSGRPIDALFTEQQNQLADAGQAGYSKEEWTMMKENQAKAIENARQTAMGIKNIWQETAMDMQSTFSSMFVDGFNGELKKSKEYFKDFAQSIVKTFSDAMAKMASNMVVFGNAAGQSGGGLSGLGGLIASGVMAFFGGGFSGAQTGTGSVLGGPSTNYVGSGTMLSYHTGGVIRKAHSGYLASDEVPLIAQAGEGILSKRATNRLGRAGVDRLNRGDGGGGGAVTININPVITAWDASDIYRNRKQISDVIAQDIMANGNIRKVIQQGIR